MLGNDDGNKQRNENLLSAQQNWKVTMFHAYFCCHYKTTQVLIQINGKTRSNGCHASGAIYVWNHIEEKEEEKQQLWNVVSILHFQIG